MQEPASSNETQPSLAPQANAGKLHLDLGASLVSLPDREELPPLAALFQINFDVKAGFGITSPHVREEI
jgi:hypothetical protein